MIEFKIFLYIIIIFSAIFHEFFHAWMANVLGDPTAKYAGRLTLNPLKHMDMLGTVIIPLFLLFFVGGFIGWAKPVPFDPYAVTRKHPAGVMMVAAAGPLSNLILAIVASIPFQTGLFDNVVAGGGALFYMQSFLITFIYLNLVLLFFNLIPVSPLDGEKVLTYFLPPSGQATMARIRPYGPMLLMLLLFAGRGFFSTLILGPVNRILELLVF